MPSLAGANTRYMPPITHTYGQHTKMRQHIDMSDQVGSFSVQDNYPIAIELVFKMDDQTS